jgi:hypothetical protein
VYGTIIKVVFSAATIALAAGVLASRTLAGRAKVAILLGSRAVFTIYLSDRAGTGATTQQDRIAQAFTRTHA